MLTLAFELVEHTEPVTRRIELDRPDGSHRLRQSPVARVGADD